MKKNFQNETEYFIVSKDHEFILSFPYGDGLMRFRTLEEAENYIPKAEKLYPEFTIVIVKREIRWTVIEK